MFPVNHYENKKKNKKKKKRKKKKKKEILISHRVTHTLALISDLWMLLCRSRMSDFLADCAERIIVLGIVHRRIINRFHKFILWLGIPLHRVQDTKPNEFCRIVSEFALEYRTTRERVIQQLEKKANHRERNKTRGKMITEVSYKRCLAPPSLPLPPPAGARIFLGTTTRRGGRWKSFVNGPGSPFSLSLLLSLIKYSYRSVNGIMARSGKGNKLLFCRGENQFLFLPTVALISRLSPFSFLSSISSKRTRGSLELCLSSFHPFRAPLSSSFLFFFFSFFDRF